MKGNRALLEKYLLGKCTAEEISFLERWIQTDEAAALMEEMIAQQWDERFLSAPPDHQRLYEKIRRQLPKQKSESSVQSRDRRPSRWRYSAVAALLLIAGAAVFLFLKDEPSTPNPAPALTTKETKRGQKTTITLSDGTRVILNAESSFTYPGQFADSVRRVSLRGEGYFEVAEDARRPFVVSTATVETRVLGTSFNLRSYPEDTATQVALLSGMVKVRRSQPTSDTSSLLLLPGRMAVYLSSSNTLSEIDFDSTALTAWKENTLYFRQAGYQDIITTLQRWYGVTIEYQSDREPDWSYNGEFKNKSLNYVLQSIGYACRFEFTIRDETVIIKDL